MSRRPACEAREAARRENRETVPALPVGCCAPSPRTKYGRPESGVASTSGEFRSRPGAQPVGSGTEGEKKARPFAGTKAPYSSRCNFSISEARAEASVRKQADALERTVVAKAGSVEKRRRRTLAGEVLKKLRRKAVWLASGAEDRRNLKTVQALPGPLRACIRYECERPLKGDRNLRTLHRLPGQSIGDLRRVRLTVREMPDGQRFYDRISERTENLAVMANAGSAEEATLDHARFSAITMEHLSVGFHYRDQTSVLAWQEIWKRFDRLREDWNDHRAGGGGEANWSNV